MLCKVIISGSTSGTGKAITQELLSAGHAVIGLGRIDFNNLTVTENLLKEIQAEHRDVSVIVGNAGFGKIRTVRTVFCSRY